MRRGAAAGWAAALVWIAAEAGADAGARMPTTLVVCPTASTDPCEYRGGAGIQQAIDAARDGDTVRLQAGIYALQTTRDVVYQIYTMPGFVVIDGKHVDLAGEPGTVLEGDAATPGTGIVVNRARVSISAIELRGFATADAEDDRYDGHGIFVIDSTVMLDSVSMSRIAKMGLTLRGESMVDAVNLSIADGHIGIWLEESAHLTLRDSRLVGNESAGICAYAHSAARVYRSLIERNRDDGLYADDWATIYAADSTIRGNKPYGARAVKHGRIHIESGRLVDNEHNASRSLFGRPVTLGPGVTESAAAAEPAAAPADGGSR